jgi:hypothetical protein
MKIIAFLTLTFCCMALQAQSNTPSPRHFWHTLETSVSPEEIWSIWTQVDQWDQWDTGLKKAELKGPMRKGAQGIITSLEGRKSTFRVVEWAEGSSFTFKTNLPLGGLYVKRSLEIKNGKTSFTHEVWFKRLTAGIFSRQFGPQFQAMLPDVMNNIIQIAQN